MPNVNSPFGLRPIGIAGGGDVRCNTYMQYTIAGGLVATIDEFSPVVLTGTGTNITAGAGTGEFLVGTFMGCQYINAFGVPQWSNNWVSGTAIKANTVCKAFVYDDPVGLFEIQGDSGVWVAADVGMNVDYGIGTRNAVVDRAGTIAVRGTPAVTATLMLRILELSPTVTPNDWGAYARLVVRINAHRHSTSTGA